MLLLVAREVLHPAFPRGRATCADAAREVLVDTLWHQELFVLGPSVRALRRAHLVLAERFAVGGGSVLLVRRAVTDVAVDDDQRRPLALATEPVERGCNGLRVVGVREALDPPTVGFEARAHVLGERERRVALDRDAVVVVEPDEV